MQTSNSRIVFSPTKLSLIKSKLKDNDPNATLKLLSSNELIFENVLRKFIRGMNDTNVNAEALLTLAASSEILRIEKRLDILSYIANLATLFGFLGTVLGIISSFITISQQTAVLNPSIMASGIYEALVTTAAGLIVCITSTVAHNVIVPRFNRLTQNLEFFTNTILEYVK